MFSDVFNFFPAVLHIKTFIRFKILDMGIFFFNSLSFQDFLYHIQKFFQAFSSMLSLFPASFIQKTFFLAF